MAAEEEMGVLVANVLGGPDEHGYMMPMAAIIYSCL